MDIYARTFSFPGDSGFQVCLLYDPLVARKRGAAYPIKLQLCDSSGQNLSSPSIVVHAISVTLASTNAPGPLDDTGNANADFDFRYDATLGGYIFNLSLRGFPTGTYDLNFTAGSDPAVHSARFAVRPSGGSPSARAGSRRAPGGSPRGSTAGPRSPAATSPASRRRARR